MYATAQANAFKVLVYFFDIDFCLNVKLYHLIIPPSFYFSSVGRKAELTTPTGFILISFEQLELH